MSNVTNGGDNCCVQITDSFNVKDSLGSTQALLGSLNDKLDKLSSFLSTDSKVNKPCERDTQCMVDQVTNLNISAKESLEKVYYICDTLGCNQ